MFLRQYQLALHQIDSLRRDGRFVGVDGTIPEGQGIIMAHLNECHELVEMVRSLTIILFYTTTTHPVCLQLKESMNEEETEDEPETELDDEDDDDDDYGGVRRGIEQLRVSSGTGGSIPFANPPSASGSDTDGEGLKLVR